ASSAAPKASGTCPSRRRRSSWRPAIRTVTNTRIAATTMNTTCLVGETSIPKRCQPVGRCHSPNPNGSSTTRLSDVCSKIALPMSGPCIIARTSSRERAAATARRGTRATPAADRATSGAWPRSSGRRPDPSPPRSVPPPTPREGGRPSPFRFALSRFPFRGFRVALDPIVQAHEPAHRTQEESRDRQERASVQPAVHDPAEPAEHEDDGGELKADGDVRVALTEIATEPISVVVGHVARGNLPACEKFRKQGTGRANLCGAWEYDVLTLRPDDAEPFPFAPPFFPASRRRRAARATGPGARRPPGAGGAPHRRPERRARRHPHRRLLGRPSPAARRPRPRQDADGIHGGPSP